MASGIAGMPEARTIAMALGGEGAIAIGSAQVSSCIILFATSHKTHLHHFPSPLVGRHGEP